MDQGVEVLGQGESFLLVLLGLDKGKVPFPNSVWEEELELEPNSPPLHRLSLVPADGWGQPRAEPT